MTFDQARQLQTGDRIVRLTSPRPYEWLQVVKVEDRGVVIDSYYGGVNHGHRELLDWRWLLTEQGTNPFIKL